MASTPDGIRRQQRLQDAASALRGEAAPMPTISRRYKTGAYVEDAPHGDFHHEQLRWPSMRAGVAARASGRFLGAKDEQLVRAVR